MSETTGREALARIIDDQDDRWQHSIGAGGYDPDGPPLWLADAVLAHFGAVLSDEATVEAAARADWDSDYPAFSWDEDLSEAVRDGYRQTARSVIAVVAERFGIEADR